MLDRETIIAAFRCLSVRLQENGVVGELNVLGGTAMVLGFQARQSTKDVDAIFAPVEIVRREAIHVAAELDLPPDWLNDAAKGFVSPNAEFHDLSGLELPNLRVQLPTAEYLLAMKVMAARTGFGQGSSDKEDIRFLVRHLRLHDIETIMSLVARYYDPAHVLPRSMYLVEEILAEEFPS